MKKAVLEEQEFNKRVARNVIVYRTKAGISDEELSKRINKPKDFIYKLEHLKLIKELDTWTAMCIATELNIYLSQLIEEDNFVNKILLQED